MLYYVQRHPYSICGFSIMILQLSTRFAGADFWKNPTVFHRFCHTDLATLQNWTHTVGQRTLHSFLFYLISTCWESKHGVFSSVRVYSSFPLSWLTYTHAHLHYARAEPTQYVLTCYGCLTVLLRFRVDLTVSVGDDVYFVQSSYLSWALIRI